MSVSQTVENVYLRQDTMQLTRKHFWRLLGMLAILTLLPLCLEKLLTLLGDLLTAPETLAVVNSTQEYTSAEKLTSKEPMLQAIYDLFTSPKFLLFNLFYGVVTGVVGAGLLMGQTAELLRTGRGETPHMTGVFGRMNICFKAWLLELWTGLKIIFWLLPGMLFFLAGAWLAGADRALAGVWTMLGGIGVMLALAIPAFYRYWLAPYIMADEPHRSIRECIGLSKELMQGRKLQCFKLTVPLVLKILSVMWLVNMAGALVLGATGLTENARANGCIPILAYIAAVWFFLQVDVVQAMFYLKRRAPAANAQDALITPENQEEPEQIAP